MLILIDIVHPAHVHFYRHMITEFEQVGIGTVVASRQREVTTDLLDRLGIDHMPVGRRLPGRLGLAYEFVSRVVGLLKLIRQHRPDLVLTRNPSGAVAGRLRGIPVIFDSDDGPAAGLHFLLGKWCSTILTTPTILKGQFGPKHVQYDSYKALAYLHSARFKSDPTVRMRLGVHDRRYSVVRLVAMNASHDSGLDGLSSESAASIVKCLESIGPVFVSAEDPELIPPGAQPFPLGSEDLHSALAEASIYVGDSQTVATEAALLGTPSVHISSWSKRLDVHNELERAGVLRSYPIDAANQAVDDIRDLVADTSGLEAWALRAAAHTQSKIDLTGWYVDLVTKMLDRVANRAQLT